MLGKEYNIDSETNLDGIFIGQVIDNKDPKAIERVRVRVIGVHDMDNDIPANSIWAAHLAPSKQNSGEIPDIGDFLYVTFLQNNPSSCLWLGWCRVIA